MPLVISAISAIVTSLILMQLLFEDLNEFKERVRAMIVWFPISVVMDYGLGNDVLRAWIWMVTGPMIGVIVYASIAR